MEQVELDIKALEQHKEFLRQEIAQEGIALEKAVEEKDRFLSELSALRAQEKSRKENLDARELELFKQSNHVSERERAMNTKEQSFSVHMQFLQEQEKKASKALNGVNLNVIKAREELEGLQEEVEKQREVIQKGKKTALRIMELENELQALEKKKELKALEYTEVIERAEKDFSSIKSDTDELVRIAERAKQGAEASQTKKEQIDHEYLVKKKDLDIVLKRIEREYQKAFPELRTMIKSL